MTKARRVLVATGNKGKVAEIRAALDIDGWEFLTAEEAGFDALHVEEHGSSFLENALLKGRAYREAFGLAALADDSGLEVDALGGGPGVHSRYYAGDDATDAENNAKLLAALGDTPDTERTARFRSVIVLVNEDGSEVVGEGSCEGSILREPRGDGGFGYDPLFAPDAEPGFTMAELPMERKNAVSHRGAALRALREALADI